MTHIWFQVAGSFGLGSISGRLDKQQNAFYSNRRDSSSGRASASCAVGQDGCRIDTWPRHTKDVIKMVPVATLLSAQHYKASAGFSSLTNHASLTSHNEQKKKKKRLIIINVCIDRRTEWKTGIRAKFVILLKYRNYYYYYYYYLLNVSKT